MTTEETPETRRYGSGFTRLQVLNLLRSAEFSPRDIAEAHEFCSKVVPALTALFGHSGFRVYRDDAGYLTVFTGPYREPSGEKTRDILMDSPPAD